MSQKIVSVIIPAYNSCRFIHETLFSVIGQSYSCLEVIVVDDDSKDNTVNIVRGFIEADPRIQLIVNEKNMGAAYSRNMGLEHSTGEYIAFIDADDIWFKNKIKRQLSFMVDKGIGFSYTSYDVINEAGDKLGKTIDGSGPVSLNYYDLLLKKSTVGCSTVMLSLEKTGGFRMPNIRTGQDYATWLSILRSGQEAYLLKESLGAYRIVKGSISRNKYKKAKRQWSIYREVEGLSLVFSIYAFISYALRAVFR